MSLTGFLNSLMHEGRVQVDPCVDRLGRVVAAGDEELREATAFLREFERQYRYELVGTPPLLAPDAMLWGACNIQRACSLLAYREVDDTGVRRVLSTPCPEPPSLAAVYSVDLTFRFLPDLMRMARAASPEDPLVEILGRWGQDWPLSSVGIASVPVTQSPDFLDDPCLRQLYVDRILAEQDESRLDDPRTLEAVLESVGRHSELLPKLAARLAAK